MSNYIISYDILVFVIMVRRLFVFRRFRQVKYIRSEKEISLMTKVIDILVIIVLSKCIGFKFFYYVINLYYVSSFFMVFSDFDSIFLSMYC